MEVSTRNVKEFVSRQIYVALIVNLNNVNLHEKAGVMQNTLYLITLGTLVYTLTKTQRPRCIRQFENHGGINLLDFSVEIAVLTAQYSRLLQ